MAGIFSSLPRYFNLRVCRTCYNSYHSRPYHFNEDKFQVGDQIHGFVVEKVSPVPDYKLTAVELKHRSTGAEHLHLARQDTNNVFCVAFKTVPMDDTGVPHILEHSVLCGSQKYPCRDPFFKMLNRSLSTFMNAFTSSDCTMYPYSTQNEQDFKNLMSVYCDAVFFPKLSENDFRQEGWRLEHENIHDKNSPVVFKGVVFNEMKGYFANSESLFETDLQRRLYPSHTYSHVFGGHPLHIVDLKWKNLKKFHKEHYHPTNAKFYTYGDMPLEAHLEQIDAQVLRHFQGMQSGLDIDIPFEERWKQPRAYQLSCAPDPLSSEPDKQSIVSLSFLLGSITDPSEALVMTLLSRLLVDGQASPFYQALIESKLGSRYSPGTGLDRSLKEAHFSVGLFGISEKDIETVQDIIWATFADVHKNGFPEDNISAVLHQIELSQKHQSGNFGLNLISSLMSVWNHNGSVVEMLNLNKLVTDLKSTLKEKPKFLQEKIREYFLENPHHLVLSMIPDENFTANQAAMEDVKLQSFMSKLPEVEKVKLYDQGLELNRLQNVEPDVSCLPTLQMSDISKEGTYPNLEYSVESGVSVQSCEQPTNGILYFKALSSITSVPDDLMMYVPLFCSVVTSLGAGDMDHREFSQACDLRTGGLTVSPQILPDHSCSLSYQQGVLLSSHCLQHNIPYMMSLWETLCKSPRFSDIDLISVLIKMAASDVLATIPSVGHKYAITSSSASLSPVAKMTEMFFGLSQVLFLKSVVEEDTQLVANKLEAIAAHVFDCSQMRCSVNGDLDSIEASYNPLAEFIRNLPGSPRDLPAKVQVEDFTPHRQCQHHPMPYPVNYVSTSIPGAPYSHLDAPVLKVLTRLMTNKFLHREIREKGGAYGSGATLSNGTIAFYSYRDPNTLETLKTYEDCMNWACSGGFNDSDVFEAKLGIFAQIDSPVSPGYKGSFEFLSQVTKEMQETQRAGLFAVNANSLVTAAKKYFAPGVLRSSCIIGLESEEITTWSK